MSDSIHDETVPGSDDSALLMAPGAPGILRIYQSGPTTVIGFAGQDVPDEVCIAAYREQLFQLLETHGCRVLAFDLTGVKLIPSGMLGVLITLKKRVDKIELYNASADIRSVLETTNLVSMFDLKDVAL